MRLQPWGTCQSYGLFATQTGTAAGNHPANKGSWNRDTPSHHPFLDGIFPYLKHLFFATPMTMETSTVHSMWNVHLSRPLLRTGKNLVQSSWGNFIGTWLPNSQKLRSCIKHDQSQQLAGLWLTKFRCFSFPIICPMFDGHLYCKSLDRLVRRSRKDHPRESAPRESIIRSLLTIGMPWLTFKILISDLLLI